MAGTGQSRIGGIAFTVALILPIAFAAPQFAVNNGPGHPSCAETPYFSVMTITVVGYGDIAPASDLVRAPAVVQVMLGLLLLLFGFDEITSYARERMEHMRK